MGHRTGTGRRFPRPIWGAANQGATMDRRESQQDRIRLERNAADDRAKAANRTSSRLAHRLRCFAYWRGVLASWPGGLVPVGTAARMLGVSRARLWALMREGRVSVLELPTWVRADRLVPVDALMGLGTPTDAGRGHWKMAENPDRIGSIPRNPWADGMAAALEIAEKGRVAPGGG